MARLFPILLNGFVLIMLFSEELMHYYIEGDIVEQLFWFLIFLILVISFISKLEHLKSER